MPYELVFGRTENRIKLGGLLEGLQSLHMSRIFGIDCTETADDSLRISVRFFE
jgi:hypothetical protein